MRLTRCLARALLALCMLFASTAQAGTLEEILDRGTLRVGLSLFTPWALQDKDGSLRGFEVQVATQLAQDIDVKPEFKVVEWDQLIDTLNRGEVDVIIAGMGITPKRALRVNFTIPYAPSGVSMATHLESTKDIKSLAEMNVPGTRLAVVGGTVSDKLAREVFDQAQIKVFPTSDAAKEALLKGEVQAYVASSPIPRFIALEHPDKVDVPLSKPLLTYKTAMAVRKGDPDFLAFLNAWITAREADSWLPTTHKYWFKSLRWRQAPPK
jgi:polar amino acid transport system substrate-binding protein